MENAREDKLRAHFPGRFPTKDRPDLFGHAEFFMNEEIANQLTLNTPETFTFRTTAEDPSLGPDSETLSDRLDALSAGRSRFVVALAGTARGVSRVSFRFSRTRTGGKLDTDRSAARKMA